MIGFLFSLLFFLFNIKSDLKILKVIKGKEIHLKRLKYVMSLHDKPIRLDKIKEFYTII